MGFFSKIKNIFSGSTQQQAEKTRQPESLQTDSLQVKDLQTETLQSQQTQEQPSQQAQEQPLVAPMPDSTTSAKPNTVSDAKLNAVSDTKAYVAPNTPPNTSANLSLSAPPKAPSPTTDVTQNIAAPVALHEPRKIPGEQEKNALFSKQEYLDLGIALRKADPKLSVWLGIVLKDVHKADETLWQRVRFLLTSLEAPAPEIDSFIENIKKWLESMGYEELEDFRSELQYRLALALDLEDEEDERNRLFIKLSEGLSKTREQLSKSLNLVFASGRQIDASLWEELEETLIMADVGFETAMKLTTQLRRRAEHEKISDAGMLRSCMAEEMLEAFKPIKRITAITPPEVIMVVGVNGVGKTTTIAKLCHRAVLQGKKVMLVAGDTFRAAAVEQLEIWAERANAGFYAKGHGADPAAVAYEALEKAMREGYDTVFIDTAGRLHTKTNLMEELTKISKVVDRVHKGAPHRTILVIDATTGQNALTQIKLFNEATKLDDLVLTKLDGTAKGGIAVAAALQYNIPISFVGLGEKMEDLRPFNAKDFIAALLT